MAPSTPAPYPYPLTLALTSRMTPLSHYTQTSIVFDRFASAVYDVGDYHVPASYVRTNMDPFVSVSSPSSTLNLNTLLALLGIPQYIHTRVCIWIHIYMYRYLCTYLAFEREGGRGTERERDRASERGRAREMRSDTG